MATVQKRGNSYKITVSSGYDMNGRQIRKYLTWTPEPGLTEKQLAKELERVRVDFERKVETGQNINSSIRFAEYAALWLSRGKERSEKPLSPKTYDRYVQLLERINAAIGHIRLSDIQPHHIRELLDNLREEGIKDKVVYKALPATDITALIKAKGISLHAFAQASGLSDNSIREARAATSNISQDTAEKISKALGVKVKDLFSAAGENDRLSERTVLHHYRVLSAILNSAVVDDTILQANPAKRVRPPKCELQEAVYLDEVEAGQLLDKMESEPAAYRAAIRLILYTGMRRGEALGLQWQDIDFENSLISITKALLYTKSKGVYIGKPKSKKSIRTIKIPSVAIATLREYKAIQNEQRLILGDAWIDESWVFTTWNGAHLHPDTLSGWFHQFIQKNNMQAIHVHSLRHTNATLMIAGGENIRTVSKRLGHSQTSTTMNIYSHAIESADAKAAQLLEDIFTPAALRKK